MKILAVSDKVDELLYSPAVRQMFGDVDVVLGCGDLPYYYLEYLVSMLGGPLFYVIGNHSPELKPEHRRTGDRVYPSGCENIHRRVVRHQKLLIAGLEGCMRYNDNPNYQYTEQEMASKVWGLAPALLLNRVRYGRYLDILVTHAPPADIHDLPDPCHRGFRAFRTLMDRFRPRYLVHGHVHVYSPSQSRETVYRETTVINAYGYRTLEIDEDALQ